MAIDGHAMVDQSKQRHQDGQKETGYISTSERCLGRPISKKFVIDGLIMRRYAVIQ
jgi:hypothetical protein